MKKIISKNKKAYYDYFVEEEIEAGLSLLGSEVKSIREGHISIGESFVKITENGRQAILLNVYIKEFHQSSYNNHTPTRNRVLLLKKKEIRTLAQKVKIKGYTLKVLEIFLKGHLIKAKIGLCRGKKNYDKRHEIKKKEVKRKLDRITKNINQKG